MMLLFHDTKALEVRQETQPEVKFINLSLTPQPEYRRLSLDYPWSLSRHCGQQQAESQVSGRQQSNFPIWWLVNRRRLPIIIKRTDQALDQEE